MPGPAAMTEEFVSLPGGGELRLLRPRDSEALIDEHAFEEDEFLPYWAELWPSGLALARAVSGRSLRGARVLELGCGLGAAALAAACAGGRVLATDWSSAALALLERNARLNDLCVEIARVDWLAPEALVARAPFDLVLAADVLYERRYVSVMLDLLPRLGTEVWLADPGRAFTGAFLEQAPRHFELTARREGTVTIHRLLRRRGAPGAPGAPGIPARCPPSARSRP